MHVSALDMDYIQENNYRVQLVSSLPPDDLARVN
jgi:hypothetical protein